MLAPEARAAGFRPVFATHDDAVSRTIAGMARRAGWGKDQYEFELLYGVRPEWQQELRERGYAVRVYLPFGTDWWPYAIRRVGEHPHNALLLGRAMLGGGYRMPRRGSARGGVEPGLRR